MALNSLGLGLLFTAKDLASGTMKQVRNGFAQTRDEVGKFGSRSKDTFKQFGVGMVAMGAGLGALAILGSTIDDAREFGKAIDLVRTEVDEATFSQRDMRDITIDMGKQFGKMPKDEAEALYKAVALGANTAAKSTAIMTTANQLAVAGNSDLKTTMDALGGTLNAYHMDMTRASEVSDAMFTAMKGGNTTVEAIAGSIGRAAPLAYKMGIGLDELMGSMAVMTNKGIQASEAVSGLHGAMANIAHPSKEATAEAARLGIKFNEAAVRGMGFQKFLHSIVDNSKFSQDSLTKLFTSVEGSGAMAMLAGDLGNVDAIMGEMSNKTGATSKGFDIMAQGLDFQTNRMKANFSALKIRVGEFLEPIAAKGLGLLNRLLGAFTNLAGPIQGVIVHLAMGAASLLALVGGVAATIAAVKIMGAALLTFGGGALGTVVAALGPAIAAVALFAGAAILVREAYDKNLGGFGGWFDGIYSQVKLSFDALVQLFTDGGFSGAIREEFLNGSNSAINFAVQLWLAFNRAKNFVKGFVDGFLGYVEQMQPTFDALRGAVDKLLASFGILSLTTGEAGSAFDQAGAKGKETGTLIAKLVEIVIQGVTAFIDFSSNIAPAIKWVGELASKLPDLSTAVDIVKVALVAYTTYMVGTAAYSAGAFAASLVPAIGSLATLVSSLSIGGAVSGFRAAMTSLTAGSAAGLVPVLALTAAVTALYLAYDQWQGFQKAMDGSKDANGKRHGWQDMKNKFFSSGVEDKYGYDASLGDAQGMHIFTNKERAARDAAAASGPQMSPTIPNSSPSSISMPALSAMTPQSTLDPEMFASAASAAAAAAVSKVPPMNVKMTGEVDGQVLISFMKKANASGAADAFDPSGLDG